MHCEETISRDESRILIGDNRNIYERVKSRCTPDKPVAPDKSTADFNPFPPPSRRLK
jgi:hypothetical protein